MKVILLLLVVPYIVTADLPCPDSNISCPDDKICCEVNGQNTCCDAEDNNVGNVHILEGKMKFYTGEPPLEHAQHYPNESVIVEQGIFTGKCNFLSCSGKCCKDYCCLPGRSWTCCADNKCCPPGTQCCPVGCCPKRQDCCAGGCCKVNQRCCGSWCCGKKQQCGLSFNSCYGKGANFTPVMATIVLMAAAALMSRHL